MTQTSQAELFDNQVRHYIYEYFVRYQHAPTILQCVQALSSDVSQIQATYHRLAEGKALVLQNNGEILMAEPFSAVPTAFYVEVEGNALWGNCIWDAFGIPAMLKRDARIITSCGCCNDAMTVEIRDSELLNASGVVHFAIPPKDWWKNVVFA